MKKSPGLRVLVVDDEALIRWSLAETLADAGLSVTEASDGVSTMRALSEAGPFDVVVLDYRLPDSNDLNLLATIRRVSPRTAVVVMTAFGTPEMSSAALKMGAYCVVPKPFEMHEMADLVLQADRSALFADRLDAGRQLAARLPAYAGRSDVIVLALPRGGVPVAHEVARVLRAPLDVFLVRKLGVPGHPELAMGAIAEGGVEVLSLDLIRHLGVPESIVREVAVRERLELDRRDTLYRGNRRLVPVRGRVVILIDDGLATGSTMQAAVTAQRRLAPARIVVAVPVGASDTCARLAQLADEVVCLATPEPFQAVGLWYERFAQTTDEEVQRYLHFQ
jgi:predicted phosphoribosyltransferase/ActR/RegA family two-component response regulator